MKSIILSLFISICFAIRSQPLQFVHYTTNNSTLLHDMVYSVDQDLDKRLWIATDDGLMSFDGINLTDKSAGLRSRYVIASDAAAGNRWIATWKGGIHIYKQNRHYAITSRDKSGFSLSTNAILTDGETLIAHAFGNYMVYKIDLRNLQLHPIDLFHTGRQQILPGDPNYLHFLKTRSGTLLGYGKCGIFKLRHNRLELIQPAINVDEITTDPEGTIYVRKGLDVFSSDLSFRNLRWRFRIPKAPATTRFPVKLTLVSPDWYCVGYTEQTEGQPTSYQLHQRSTGKQHDLQLETGTKMRFTSCFADQEGTIWLGTDGDGLYHVFIPRFTGFSSANYFRNTGVNCIRTMADHSLLIGTKKGAYRLVNHTLSPLSGTNGHYILKFTDGPGEQTGIIVDGIDAPHWLTSNRGEISSVHCDEVYRFPDYNASIKPLVAPALTIRSPKGKNLTTHNLRYSLSGIVQDDKLQLWIATLYELMVYRPEKGLVPLQFSELRGLRINCLCFHPENGICIGTNNGLFMLRGDKLTHFGTQNGLTNLTVNCLLTDSPNSLWIGTQNGLFCLKNKRLHILKKRDGLMSDDVSCLARFTDNVIVAGGSKGITLIPAHFRQTMRGPAVNPEIIQVNEKTVRTSAAVIQLTPPGTILVRYRTPTFIYPELVQYRYRLSPDQGWIYTRNHSLYLSNLKPGKYRLELSSRLYNSPFGKTLKIPFVILPPWWKSTWFFSIVFLVFGGMITMVVKLLLWRQRRQLQTRFELSELKMKALQAQLNPHFISNAMNVMQYYMLKGDALRFNRYLAQFSNLTRLFLETSIQGIVPLHKELELLSHYLELETMRFEHKFRFTLTVDPQVNISETYIPGLLIQPFAENSIQHGLNYLPPAIPGELHIRIHKEGAETVILIDDNGIGRDASARIGSTGKRAFQSRSGAILRALQHTYNSLPGNSVTVKIKDKRSSDGQSTGTLVTIRILLQKDFAPFTIQPLL